MGAEDTKAFLQEITNPDPMAKPKPGEEERKIKHLYKRILAKEKEAERRRLTILRE